MKAFLIYILNIYSIQLFVFSFRNLSDASVGFPTCLLHLPFFSPNLYEHFPYFNCIIHCPHFYYLCSALNFLVSIFPWGPSNLIFISEIDLPFFSYFLLEFWQLVFHHLLPSCHPFQNSCFCFVVFFHRNDCFIGFFKFMAKYFIAIIFISSLHLPGNVPYLGYFLWLLLIFFHCKIFASILPILSIFHFSFTTYYCMSGLSQTSFFAGSPWGTDRRPRVTLHYY